MCPLTVIHVRASSGSEARAEAGGTCGRKTPTFRQGLELTSAAGAEHASDTLRRGQERAGQTCSRPEDAACGGVAETKSAPSWTRTKNPLIKSQML
jgi:hypothetical protein